jgi:RND family efflux transporter MFP subunit
MACKPHAVPAAACLAALSALWLTGCDGKTPAGPSEPGGTAGAALRVETVAVGREDLKRVSETTPAELLPYERTDLYAKVSGFIKELRVDYGDRVKKGDLLAVLDVPEMDKELAQKQALVRRAEADLVLAKEAVRATEAEYRRRKSQYERLTRVGRGGVIDQEAIEETQFGFEASKAKWDMAKADVGVKEANVQVARADRDQMEVMTQYTRVVAPFDGVVTKRHLHTGAFISTRAGEVPILTVVRTDLLRVVVDVPEKDVPYLNKEGKVVADLDARPGRKFEWKVTRMAPVLGPGKKVRVEVDVPNPDGVLYPGMYGHATVVLEERPGALTLPSSCVGRDDKGAFVWLAVAGKARQQRVTVGLNDGKKAEIASGLGGTEEVICGSKEALRDGQLVSPQRAAGPKK